MAMQQIPPVEAHIRWDRRRSRPATVRWGQNRVSVIEVASHREELAAYPAARGPRVTYLLETDRGRASLVFDGRRRRWYVEAVDLAA
jgi:hypothetical protein